MLMILYKRKLDLMNNAKMKIHFFRSTECIIAPNFCYDLVYYCSSQFVNQIQIKSNNEKKEKNRFNLWNSET